MGTVRSLIDRAMRVPGVLAVSQVAENEDAQDYLLDLQDVYLGLIGKGANLSNVLVTADYTAGENVRIAYSGLASATITLPTTIEETSENPSTDTAVDNDNRQPHDFAVAQVSGTVPAVYTYDQAIGDWISITGLALTDTAPWSTFLQLGLVAMLAVLVADKHGRKCPPHFEALAQLTEMRIIAKLQASGDDDGSVFFQPDRRQEWA